MSTLPESVVKDVESMMSKYDKNKDNSLSWDEVVECLKNNGSKDPHFAAFSMFTALDKNRDKKISLSEVQAHKMDVYAKKCEKMIKRDVNNMLKEYDTDKNREISWDECVEYFKKDKEVSDPEMNANYLFASIDRDQNKKITVTEIREYVKRFNNLYPSQ